MKLRTVFLSSTAILLATSAFAADLPTKKAPPAPTLAVAPYSWTGFYLGAGGGFAFMNAKDRSSSYMSTSAVANGSNRSDLSKWGVFGTVEAGYDYQMNRFVVGAFTDFDLRSLKARKSTIGTSTAIASAPTPIHNVWYKVGNSWDAGVRLGYLVNDRNLLYALGGYSGAQISSGARLDLYNFGGGYVGSSPTASELGWKSGWMLGAGWEEAITDHVSLKLEYRYADYGKAKSSNYASTNSYARQSGDVSVQSVRAVLNYRF